MVTLIARRLAPWRVAAGPKGTIETSITSSPTVVMWVVAFTLLGLGGAVIGSYVTGS